MQHDISRITAALSAVDAVSNTIAFIFTGDREDDYRRALDLLDSQGVVCEIDTTQMPDGPRERVRIIDGPRQLVLVAPEGVNVWTAQPAPIVDLTARRLARDASAARMGGGLGDAS